MKGKKKIASILACAMLLSAAPVEAMAYTVPDTVRVGLESVCKNVASASIGVWELQIGTQKGDGFQRRRDYLKRFVYGKTCRGGLCCSGQNDGLCGRIGHGK